MIKNISFKIYNTSLTLSGILWSAAPWSLWAADASAAVIDTQRASMNRGFRIPLRFTQPGAAGAAPPRAHWAGPAARPRVACAGGRAGGRLSRAGALARLGEGSRGRGENRAMKPPRSKLRGIRRKGIVGETPRFLPPLPFA